MLRKAWGLGPTTVALSELFADERPRTALFIAASQSAIGILLYYGMLAPPSPVAKAFLVLAPALLGLLLNQATRRQPGPLPEGKPVAMPRWLPAFCVLALVIGMSFGFVRILTTYHAAPPQFQVYNLGGIVSWLLVSILCLALREQDFFESFCLVVFPVLAAGFLVLPTFFGGTYLVAILNLVGFASFYSFMWFVSTSMAKADPAIVRPVALMWLALSFGQLVGALVAFAIPGSILDVAGPVASLMLFLLSMVFLMFFYKKHQESLKAATGSREAERKAQVQRIAAAYRLTNREKDVFDLMVQGFHVSQIQEELVLSKSTVKTHVANIYRKLGIHSKTELSGFLRKEAAQHTSI